MNRRSPPPVCPLCGAEVPEDALACPECGADERTGWSEAARYAGLDLPEESFDYQDYVSREFGNSPRRRRGFRFWWVVAVVVLLSFLWAWLRALI